MKNKNTTMRINQIKRGDLVQAGYRQWLTTNRFLGFYTDRLGSGLGFSKLSEIKSQVADRDCHYALFQDTETGDEWAAYYWTQAKRFCVGTSADALKLRTLECDS